MYFPLLYSPVYIFLSILLGQKGGRGAIRKIRVRTLVVQCLRVCAPNVGGLGLIPGQGTRSHILQLGVHMPQLKIPDSRSHVL